MPPSSHRSPAIRALLALLVFTTVGAGPARAANPQVTVQGGALRSVTEHEIGIWANSPQAAVTILNASGGFQRTKLRWFNVPVGTYMVSPHGVADAASLQGGSLVAQVVLAGNGTSSWTLDPNLKGGYTFAVTGGDLGGLGRARQAGGVQFAVHLGNSGLGVGALQQALGQQPFPTYLLPGNRDRRADYLTHTGEVRRDFAVGADRFLMLDNSTGRLGAGQLAWATGRLRTFRAERARRIFVFAHWPFESRGKRGMTSKREVRTLLRLCQDTGVTAVFATHVPETTRTRRLGVEQLTAGSGHAWLVKVDGDSLVSRPL